MNSQQEQYCKIYCAFRFKSFHKMCRNIEINGMNIYGVFSSIFFPPPSALSSFVAVCLFAEKGRKTTIILNVPRTIISDKQIFLSLILCFFLCLTINQLNNNVCVVNSSNRKCNLERICIAELVFICRWKFNL